jgi:hypothetical protein
MNMLRHHHIANHVESITKMRFLQSVLKQIPSPSRPQVSKPVKAAERDEMQVPVLLTPL